jgi:hypothetical protein
VATREAERAVQLREENARREAAKVDAFRGNTIDTLRRNPRFAISRHRHTNAQFERDSAR